MEQRAVRQRLHGAGARAHGGPEERAQRARRRAALQLLALRQAGEDAVLDHAPGPGNMQGGHRNSLLV